MSILDDTFKDGVKVIAFEQCCSTAGNHFTSYVALVNNLIDMASDVAVLRECGIIESKLGQDGEVANLFNNLGKGAYLDYERHSLVKLFKDMEQYSEVNLHRWRDGLLHNYFWNPWAIISLIASIFLLSLTVVQTFFAVFYI